MDVILRRNSYRQDGIFGTLFDTEGNQLAVTLEHAYDNPLGPWIPKVRQGAYNCVRHEPSRLPYETFMLENVPDFLGNPVTGILIHKGNFDKDSEGCILLGTSVVQLGFGQEMVGGSLIAFNKFMDLQANVGNFQLQIVA
jgi:hypothetical protein